MDKRYLSKRAVSLKPSGIRKFFDIVATMDDVISLGIGEPDFVTPQPILQRGVRALQDGETHYTSNSGRLDLRQNWQLTCKVCMVSATTPPVRW